MTGRGFVWPFLPIIFLILFFSWSQAAVFQIEAAGSENPDAHLILDAQLAKIENILQIDYPETVTVVIADNFTTFNAASGGGFPDWGAAAAVKSKRLIVVKSPAFFPVGKSLQELLGHELAHLMLDHAAGGKWLPRWFEEGFCQMISGEWSLSSDILVTRAVWGSWLLPLTALENVNYFGSAKASLAYAQSYLAVAALVREFGIEFIPDFLGRYKEGNNIYDAFFEATGYRYIEWINLWQQQTSQKYRLVLYIFDPSILFPLIAVLFIILFLLKIYYSNKKRKQWELEEKYGGHEQGFTAPD